MKQLITRKLKKNALTIVITTVAAGSIFVVAAYNGSQMGPGSEKGKGPKPEQKPASEMVVEQKQPVSLLSQVAVQATQVASYQAEVTGYGETKPRFELSYASEISGRIEWLAESFESGRIVKKGELLAKFDDTSYQQAVSQAKAEVATAQLELLEEQRQGEQARSEWERSGLKGEPSSPLVLRQPQLASATATLENAQKTLAKAERDLEFTNITAPFDGVIVSRDVQLGSFINVGGTVAMLYSVDRVEIEIPLSDKQWANLPQVDSFESSADNLNERWSATIEATGSDSHTGQQWSAYVERSHQYVTQDTRQRSLVLVVDKPLSQDTPLFPGTFIKATIEGVTLDNLWELPASARSQQGEIWTVDTEGLLQKTLAVTQFERQNKIYVNPTLMTSTAQVVKRPLSNFKAGMKVMPMVEEL
ncbi:efflux RND transporter periplasmic adaptor subunit [Shewanella sp. 10N.7]|uniref:efflux RND transporter periplasmic adaptor subunit n=1 Tax=Shewanella sp. 10N.7 TaxID=2885093 RepID=UPI001E4AE5D7|nr:efflux RND transporter periplasmic adaptor subunit [Shewanella sp. 10N.7]MCC4832477.1 efflux RND transporter periplasmic adaptor subunit [Shewanella sp. 10N.7]